MDWIKFGHKKLLQFEEDFDIIVVLKGLVPFLKR